MPKKKVTYRTVSLQQVSIESLCTAIATAIVVAIDVSKKQLIAAFSDAAGRCVALVRVAMPAELDALLSLCSNILQTGRSVSIVAEPTGTYSAPICQRAHALGLPVYLLSPKRVHDAAEVFDGVPSKHDPKDATVIARLHAQELSRLWKPMGPQRRELRGLVDHRSLYARPLQLLMGHLEALLARHWPELDRIVRVRQRPSLWAWLAEYPGPAAVASSVDARERLLRLCRRQIKPETIDRLIDAGCNSVGVEMTHVETRMLSSLLEEMLRLRRSILEIDAQIETALQGDAGLAPMVRLAGAVTTATVIALVGDPREFSTPAAFEKATGLNLKESSSGTQVGGVHITKRGPGEVRRVLFLMALRVIQRDPIALAWYQRRTRYGAGQRQVAVVALMRKLVKALWHVARGQDYDSHKLFDVSRLAICTKDVAVSSDEGEEDNDLLIS